MFVFKSFLFRLFVPFFLICVSSFIYGQEEFNQSYTREWGTYFNTPVNISINNDNSLWSAFQGLSDFEELIDAFFITSDAYQTSYGGGTRDAVICKLSSDGELLYGSYFGGDGYVAVSSINALNNQVYLTGRANIQANIASSGAHQETSNEVSRTAFIAKFDDDGEVNWATYLAGDRSVRINDSTVDTDGNLYFLGVTSSFGYATTGAFKENSLPPVYNEETDSTTYFYYLILGKMSSEGVLEWLTYYSPDYTFSQDGDTTISIGVGGPQKSIVSDNDNNIYVTDRVLPDDRLLNASDTNFYATPDAHQSQTNGDTDIFISKFNSDGERLWSTYFGGEGDERHQELHFGEDQQLYIIMNSNSEGLATSGVLEETLTQDEDVLTVKLDASDGSITWATYLDLQPIFFKAISTNSKGNLFLTSQSTTENYIIEDTWEDALGTISDLQLIKLSVDASEVEWSTYYNGEVPTNLGNINRMVHGADNSFYFTGRTESDTEIASEGSFAENRVTEDGTFNGFVAKFVPCQQVPQPVLESPQEFNAGQTLSNIELTPIEWTGSTPVYTWYADEEGENELSENTALQNGEVYYLGMQIRGCQEAFYPVQIGTLSTVDEDFFELSIYPNPTRGEINIQANLTEDFSVKIFSLQGKLMLEEHLSVNTANHYKISTDQILSKGMYLIQLESQGKHQIKKLMVE